MIVDGRKLEVVRIGARDDTRPTFVMLHEGLGSVALWKDFPAQLAARTGCGVVVYSRYGYGESDVFAEPRDVDYMHHEAQVVLPALLRDLQIERPILFGHSDGASIALIYAARAPQAPLALILEAPHVFVEDLSIASIASAKVAFESTDLPQKLARYHTDPTATFRGWNDIWLDPRFRDWNIEALLPKITSPVLVIQGREDTYGTAKHVRAIERAVPGTSSELLDACGHSPHRDQAAPVLAAVSTFFSKHFDSAHLASEGGRPASRRTTSM